MNGHSDKPSLDTVSNIIYAHTSSHHNSLSESIISNHLFYGRLLPFFFHNSRIFSCVVFYFIHSYFYYTTTYIADLFLSKLRTTHCFCSFKFYQDFCIAYVTTHFFLLYIPKSWFSTKISEPILSYNSSK